MTCPIHGVTNLRDTPLSEFFTSSSFCKTQRCASGGFTTHSHGKNWTESCLTTHCETKMLRASFQSISLIMLPAMPTCCTSAGCAPPTAQSLIKLPLHSSNSRLSNHQLITACPRLRAQLLATIVRDSSRIARQSSANGPGYFDSALLQ